MKTKIKLFAVTLFLTLPLAILSAEEIENPELNYLNLKAAGLHSQALVLLADWSAGIDDPALLETNLFRIDELIRHPEQFDTALEIYSRLEKTTTAKTNAETMKRLLIFKQSLLLRMNRISEAAALKKRLNFLDFSILGPLPSGTADEFDAEYPVMELLKSGGEMPGKNYPVSWFRALSDYDGTININELLPDADVLNSLFYLHTKINAPRAGLYRFMLGKTGLCSMTIDGTGIFYHARRHAYSAGQYLIEVNLPAGDHDVLIKLDASQQGAVMSCSMDFVESADAGTGKIIPGRTAYFRALQESDSEKDSAGELLLRRGYLLYRSGLNLNGTSDTLRICSYINSESPYYAAAQYYSGMSLDSYEARDEHFQKSIAAMNRNTESLFASAMINLRQGFSYKAWPIIEELKKADSSRFFYTTALANFYAANNWNNELAKISESFTNIGYPSRALYYTAVAHIQDNEYGPALDSLEKLYMFDSSNYEAFTKLRQAIEYSAKPERSLSVIQGMAGRRPNDISLLLMLASYIERLEGEQKAIPTLSAALKRSPNNSETLYRIGMVYHKTGKKDLAVFYLNESIKRNPSNHALKQYLDFLHGRDNILAGEIWNGEISELEAESDSTWKNQTAVYLLNEQVFCVNKDISYEKYVRCIVKIYDDIAVDDFNNQYIVYEPGIDFIENIRCRVINGAEISDITDRYTKQLSDPESRLYYNLEAVMIPVSDLKRGSILDFSYTLKNTGAAEYRNAFSETFYPGGSYPMVLYHAALSHPDSAKIYSFTRDIDSSKIKKEKRNGRIFYNAEFDTLEAYKHETAMPPRSEILPALYFSSYKDWDAFASWYRSLLKDKIIISDEMKKDLDALISRNDTPQEKVRKIYNHVTDSIRYVGFELGIGALQPRSTDKTYRTRMGDCKDIALVLAAFLREAGIDASIALVETRNKGTVNLNVPSIGEFNHAICYADIDGGIFLDGTRDKTSYLEMASNERNVNALVINEKTWRFVKTENPKYAPNVDNVTTIIDLKNDGSAVIKRTIEKHGDPAADARESLDDIAKKEQSTTEYWNKFFPGAAVSGLTVISSSRDNPVHYAYDVSITNFASKAEKELIFSPFPDESKYYLSYAMNSSRKFPIEVAGEFLSKSALRINLPPGCKPINLPKDKTIKHALFEVSFVYSCADGIISINSELRIKTYRIPPENYADFRAMARSIQEEESRKIILEMD